MSISLRDYLAAHAPTEPTWAFEVRMPTPRPEPIVPDRSRLAVNQDEIDAWHSERDRQRAIQWPYVWADALLAERQHSSDSPTLPDVKGPAAWAR